MTTKKLLIVSFAICASIAAIGNFSNSDAQDQSLKLNPISALEPSFPKRAVERGLEGSCDVVFQVDDMGFARILASVCSDPVFKFSAELAVSEAKYQAYQGSSRTGFSASQTLRVLFDLDGNGVVPTPEPTNSVSVTPSKAADANADDPPIGNETVTVQKNKSESLTQSHAVDDASRTTFYATPLGISFEIPTDISHIEKSDLLETGDAARTIRFDSNIAIPDERVVTVVKGKAILNLSLAYNDPYFITQDELQSPESSSRELVEAFLVSSLESMRRIVLDDDPSQDVTIKTLGWNNMGNVNCIFGGVYGQKYAIQMMACPMGDRSIMGQNYYSLEADQQNAGWVSQILYSIRILD